MLTQHSHSVSAKLLLPTALTHGQPGPFGKKGVPWRRWLLEWDVCVVPPRPSWPTSHLSAGTIDFITLQNGKTGASLNWVSRDTRRVQQITSILLPDNHNPLSLSARFLAYLLGSCETRKERETRKSSMEEEGLSLRPPLFFVDYSAGTTRKKPVHSALFLSNCSIPLSSLYRHYRNASHRVNTLFTTVCLSCFSVFSH